MQNAIEGSTCNVQPSERVCLLGALSDALDGFFNAPTQVATEGNISIVKYRTPCAQGWVLQHGVCVVRCEAEHFVNEWNVCEECNDLCTECSSAALGDCNPLTCKHASRDGQCVAACNTVEEYFAIDDRTCEPCSDLCNSVGVHVGCTGPTAADCVSCTNFTINGTCFETCPPGYVELDGACVNSGCPDQFYVDGAKCRECHELCSDCTGPALSQCNACRFVRNANGVCAAECEVEMFLREGNCTPCHPQCNACDGPNDTNCKTVGATPGCKAVVVELGEENTQCVSNCSEGFFFDRNDTVSRAVVGGYVCKECPSGFACPDGRSRLPCPLQSVTCQSGATECLPCPSSTAGSCVYNVEKTAMDAVQCGEEYTFVQEDCSCAGTPATKENVAAAESNSVFNIAIAAGGVAFLVLIGGIAFATRTRTTPEDTTMVNTAFATDPTSSSRAHSLTYSASSSFLQPPFVYDRTGLKSASGSEQLSFQVLLAETIDECHGEHALVKAMWCKIPSGINSWIRISKLFDRTKHAFVNEDHRVDDEENRDSTAN
eukprot:m.760795 g.760795  ORF g.760795 m.760795 type:complete len:546 (+) comp23204_c1_seq5:697-2334(+)